MGQKVHPTGVRVGIIKDWNAKWYADSKNFADYLVCLLYTSPSPRDRG